MRMHASVCVCKTETKTNRGTLFGYSHSEQDGLKETLFARFCEDQTKLSTGSVGAISLVGGIASYTHKYDSTLISFGLVLILGTIIQW